jgi:alanine dehydrogenase
MAVPFIDEATIRGLALSPADIRAAVRDAFVQRADGRASLIPKLGIYPPAGGLFHAMPAALQELVVVKWLTEGPKPRPGRPRLQATLLANDPVTGELLALLDGALLTGLRTAAVTALAVQAAPPRTARHVAFIGAGLQAHVHADALADLLPLRSASVLSRTTASTEGLIAHLQALGLEARPATSAREALEAADLVVTGIPFVERIEPFLEAAWLQPHAFAAAVDLGRSWRPSSWPAFARRLTDDRRHTEAFLAGGLTPDPGVFDHDLPGLLAAGQVLPPAPGPTLLFAPGIALADAAMALLVLRRLGLR